MYSCYYGYVLGKSVMTRKKKHTNAVPNKTCNMLRPPQKSCTSIQPLLLPGNTRNVQKLMLAKPCLICMR